MTKSLVKQASSILDDFSKGIKFLAGKDSALCFEVWNVLHKILEKLEERHEQMQVKNMKSPRELESVLEIEEVIEKLNMACKAVHKLSEALDFAERLAIM